MSAVPLGGKPLRGASPPPDDRALTGTAAAAETSGDLSSRWWTVLLCALALFLLLPTALAAPASSAAFHASGTGALGAGSASASSSSSSSVALPTAPVASPAAAKTAGAASPSLPAPSILPPADGWLLFQGNLARQGTSADAPPPTTNVAWSTTLPAPGTGSSSIAGGIVTSGNLIYVPSADHTVYALDARTGAIVWHYTTNGSLDSAPALDRGLLLVAGSDGTLYELNATTGAQAGLITLGIPDLGSSPLPLGANVIAPCSAGGVPSLCEFDLASGATLWHLGVGNLLASPSADPAADLVFVANTTGGVLAVQISTGTLSWSYSLGAATAIASSPVIGTLGTGPSAKTYVYVFASTSTLTGELVALYEATGTAGGGRPFFSVPLTFGVSQSTPVFTPTALIVGTETGHVAAFDPSTGAALWSVQPWTGNTNTISSSVLDASGTLLVGMPGAGAGGSGGGELLELSAANQGQTLSTIPSPTGAIVAALAITSSAIYFGANDGTVYAVGTTVPTAPNNLVAVPSNATIALSWKAPSSTGGVSLTQYAIFWAPSSGGTFLSTTVPPTTLQYTISPVTNGLAYTSVVEAVNAEGPGANATAVATPGTLPSAPTGVHVALGEHTFTLLWSPPATNGGFPVIGYVVEAWNSSTWVHQNVTLGAVSSWVESSPDGTQVYAEVAATTVLGTGPFSNVVSGAPYYAPGVLVVTVSPAAALGSLSLTVNGVATSVPTGNGSVRVTLVPGTYWVNATASGYQRYDNSVTISSGKVTLLNFTLYPPSRNPLQLSTLQIAAITAVVLVLLVVGIFLIGMRARRLRALTEGEEGGSGEDEEEDTSEGISEDRARALLQPATPASDEEGGAPVEDAALTTDEGGESLGESSSPPEDTFEVAPEAEDEEPEGPGGRLGELLERRRAGKETLKNSEENTPDVEKGPKTTEGSP